MQTLGRFCLLVALHSVLGFYHRFLRLTILFLMDFPSTFRFLAQASEVGCGFVLLGYFSRIFNLIGIILIFTFSIRFLRYTHLLSEFGLQPRSPLPPKFQPLDQTTPKTSSWKKGQNHEDGWEEKEENVEDEVFDVMALRKLVKFERQRFNAACAEIENERVAASSAAEEAMAMILRLQSEKSSIEIQANQFRRMVEQKQEYDLEVIELLRWTVAQIEYQKSLLEEQLEVYREKLRQFVSDQEIEQLDGSDNNSREDFLDFSVEYDVDHACSETDSQAELWMNFMKHLTLQRLDGCRRVIGCYIFIGHGG